MRFLLTICFTMISMQPSEATDLIFAIENGQFEGANLQENSPKLQELKKLIANSNINAKDKYENTALHYAVEKENSEVVRVLTESGADTNLPTNDGNIALHMILRNWGDALLRKWKGDEVYGDKESSANSKLICKYLLKAGADVNGTVDYPPALMVAINAFNPDAVEFLLRNGADPYKGFEEENEETVLDYAKEFLDNCREDLLYYMPYNVPYAEECISILEQFVNVGWKKMNEDEKDLKRIKKLFKNSIDMKNNVDKLLGYNYYQNKN